MGRERKGIGRRRKTEMKKIKKTSPEATFSKRRTDLFRSAGELSVLCGAEVAAIAFSPAGKAHVFGHPSADAVIDRFQNSSGSLVPEPNTNESEETASGDSEGGRGFWWEAPIENMGLTELLRHQEALQELIKKGNDRLENMTTPTPMGLPAMESPPSPIPTEESPTVAAASQSMK